MKQFFATLILFSISNLASAQCEPVDGETHYFEGEPEEFFYEEFEVLEGESAELTYCISMSTESGGYSQYENTIFVSRDENGNLVGEQIDDQPTQVVLPYPNYSDLIFYTLNEEGSDFLQLFIGLEPTEPVTLFMSAKLSN